MIINFRISCRNDLEDPKSKIVLRWLYIIKFLWANLVLWIYWIVAHKASEGSPATLHDCVLLSLYSHFTIHNCNFIYMYMYIFVIINPCFYDEALLHGHFNCFAIYKWMIEFSIGVGGATKFHLLLLSLIFKYSGMNDLKWCI